MAESGEKRRGKGRPRALARFLREHRRAPRHRPEPPAPLPEGRVVAVEGVGELFVRDSGGSGPPVLLLHGWLFPSDLTWWRSYERLIAAGYRVLATDYRGHGRGLRTQEPFRLEDCAADCAALVARLGCGPVIATGYSMGGPVAQLMARNHPEAVAGMVLCATAQEWKSPNQRLFFLGMGLLRWNLTLFPRAAGRWGLLQGGFPDNEVTSWIVAELSRGSGRDLAEAGRDLSRYDSRPWLRSVGVPAAVVVTARDDAVPPAKQRELASVLSAERFEVECDHFCVTSRPDAFNPALLRALAAVRDARGAAAPDAAVAAGEGRAA